MGIALVIGLLLAGLIAMMVVAAVVLIMLGKQIPEEHTATSMIQLNTPPDKVFAVIEDIAAYPTWVKGTGVEMLPDRNGLQVCRMRQGRNSFVLVRTRFDPPRVLERTISDDHQHFSGTWTYKVKPTDLGSASVEPGAPGSGCEVWLTEVGRVKSPIPRAIMKYMMGYHMYLNANLTALGRKLGQEARVRKA